MDDLLKQAKKAAREAEKASETPPLKERAIKHARKQLGIDLDPDSVSAKGGKVAKFEIGGVNFHYREDEDPRKGWGLYVDDRPVYALEDLAK